MANKVDYSNQYFFPLPPSKAWVALMIGNSRLHWGLFHDSHLQQSWDTPHLSPAATPALPIIPSPAALHSSPPLLLASVVPSQTHLWHSYPHLSCLSLDRVPLKNLYPDLGIDRALALWGAATTYGLPTLVIDAGTALTLTGATAANELVGGAILPGLALQLRSLHQQTAALPLVPVPVSLPSRWANNPSAAIQSGVIYSLLAGIRDFIQAWLTQFPNSSIALTGGDRECLFLLLQQYAPEIAQSIVVDAHLIFWGMNAVRSSLG